MAWHSIVSAALNADLQVTSYVGKRMETTKTTDADEKRVVCEIG